MPAADTNVLLRILLDDDEQQGRAARRLLNRGGASLFVAHVVLVEAAWVLRSSYRFTRAQLARLIEMLLETEGIALEAPDVVADALAGFRASKADFSDCLILATARRAQMLPLATFDEKLAALPDTRRLGPKRSRA